MIIVGATKQQIYDALMKANESFDHNLRFKALEEKGKNRAGLPKFRVTLTVADSKKEGASRSWNGRRVAAACWHAHGTFFDALPAGTEIHTSLGQTGDAITRPGEPWRDYNRGSMMYPAKASELCDCS